MRISDWSSDVCSSDLSLWRSCRRRLPRSRCSASWSFCTSDRAHWDRSGRYFLARLPGQHQGAHQGRWHLALRCLLRRCQLEPLQLGASTDGAHLRSEEQTSELQSLMRNSYADLRLKQTKNKKHAKD